MQNELLSVSESVLAASSILNFTKRHESSDDRIGGATNENMQESEVIKRKQHEFIVTVILERSQVEQWFFRHSSTVLKTYDSLADKSKKKVSKSHETCFLSGY